jgi:hypothetical protein
MLPTTDDQSEGFDMALKHLLRVALLSAALAGVTAAFADTQDTTPPRASSTPQNHHCKLADGTMDMMKTRKACTADKGTWAKDAQPVGAASAPPLPASAAVKK